MAGVIQIGSLNALARAAREGKGPLAPPPARLDPAAAREVVDIGVADIRSRFATGTAPDGTPWVPLKHPRPGGGQKPLSDTGRLAASIDGRVRGDEVVWHAAAAYAAVQHFGGVIVPRRGKFLAIPLTAEAARAGSPRRMPKTRAGPTPLFARAGKGGKLVGHFLLVKRVEIPARPFMGLSERAVDRIADLLAAAAAAAWKRGGGR